MSHDDSPIDEDAPGDSRLAWMIRGAKGGLVATMVMSLYRAPMFRALPPTAELWAQYVEGGGAESHPLAGYVLHALYGIGGGVVIGAVLPTVERRSPLNREKTALVSGAVLSLLLSAFGTKVIFRRLLDRELDENEGLVFHVGHLVYGLTLGTWLGARRSVGDVYDTPAEARPATLDAAADDSD